MEMHVTSNTGTATADRAMERTIRRRRRVVLRDVLLVIVTTGLLLVLVVANRDEAAIEAARNRMVTLGNVFQQREAAGLPPTPSLPQPEAGVVAGRVAANLQQVRNEVEYNALYYRAKGSGREVGVCYSRRPFVRLIGPSGRWVILLQRSPTSTGEYRYVVEWMDEVEFRQRAAELGFQPIN